MAGAYLKLADNALTVLNGSLTADAISVIVSSVSTMPSTYPYILTIWDGDTYDNPGDDSSMEKVLVTSGITTTLTVTRGYDGTTGVIHSSAEYVALLSTSAILDDSTYGIETVLDTHMDDSSIHLDTDTVKDTHVDWGTGASQVSAVDMPIADSGAKITATEVEGALQENRTAIDLNTAKDTNVSTDLSEGTSTTTTVDVDSSDGANATLVSASTSRAGLLTKAKFDEIVSNTSKETNVTTDLSEGTSTETTVDVNSSDGTNATLVSASASRAGLLTKAKFDEIVANNAKVTNATHTGDVTGGGELTIAADAVTYDKMQDATATDKLLGRSTAGAGTIEEIACTAAGRAILDDADATAQRTTLDVDQAGTDNSTDVTLNASATTGGLSISTQEISHRAATNAQTGYMTDALVTNIETNNGKVTNATHTGEVTGSGSLTVDKTAISGKGAVTAVGADYVLIGDTSDAGNLKKALVSDLGGGTTITAESFSSAVSHATTDEDAGKAFTIASFPAHAQITKIRVRADWTAGQQSNTGSALVNNGAGIAPGGTTIAYDNAVADFAVNDYIWIDDECFSVSADTGSSLTVAGGKKGTMEAFHDDNATIVKANHGVRLVLFKDTNRNYAERIIELSSIMTYKGVTDALISANDDYFGLTGDIQNIGHNDFIVIEDTADEICRVQNVNHDTVSATYDYTIFVQDDLAAHDISKDIKKLMVYDLDTPYDSGTTLYGTVFIDENIGSTVTVDVEIFTDSYA